VRINGIQPDGNVGRSLQRNGPGRVIRIDLLIDEDMMKQIPADSIGAQSLRTTLLGSTKFPANHEGHQHSLIQNNATLASISNPDFDKLIEQGYNIFNSLQLCLGKVQDIVGQMKSARHYREVAWWTKHFTTA